MKQAFIFLGTALLCALSSCTREEMSLRSETGEICFRADGFTAEVETKAAAEVTALSTFGVVCTTGAAGSETNSWSIESVTQDGASYKTGKFWPSANPSYHFYASNKALTFAASGTTAAVEDLNTDVVCAYLPSPTYKSSNELTFNHIFARIGSCNISAPEGYSVSGLSVKITPKIPDTGNGYNIRTGEWSKTKNGSPTTLCTTTGSTANKNIWLVPGTYTLTAVYTLSKGDFSKKYTKTASVNIVAGKINNISAALPDAGGDIAEIVFTVTVTAWDSNAITATFN